MTVGEAIAEVEDALENGPCPNCGGIAISLDAAEMFRISPEHTMAPCSHYIVLPAELRVRLAFTKLLYETPTY